MKKLAALFFLSFLVNFSFSQTDYKTYSWEQAKKLGADTVYSITFEKQKMDYLPAELRKFVHLKKLNLSKNNLKSLPNYVINFTQLEILDLGKNDFTVFPEEICQLTNLKKLILNRNDFTSMSDSISNLTKLEFIDLWDTPLVTFPDAFISMKNLKHIDSRGISHGVNYQRKWTELLPWVKIEFDAPCNCSN